MGSKIPKFCGRLLWMVPDAAEDGGCDSNLRLTGSEAILRGFRRGGRPPGSAPMAETWAAPGRRLPVCEWDGFKNVKPSLLLPSRKMMCLGMFCRM